MAAARGSFALTAAGTGVLAVMACEIARRFGSADWLDPLAWTAVGATILVAWPILGRREAYFLAVSATLAFATWFSMDDPLPVLQRALNQSSYMMAFLMSLGLLYEAARTSPAVLETGPYLTTRPPSRRYVALAGGTGILSAIFNAGIVSFLVPLIREGIASTTPDDPLNTMRERRQLSAVLRGFAWSILWSPTALAPLTLLLLLPGIDRVSWHLSGMGIYLVILLVGALEDKVRHRHYDPVALVAPLAFPGRSVARLAGVCLALIAIAALIMQTTASELVLALMVACPVIFVVWIAAQNGFLRPDGRGRTLRRLSRLRFDLGKAAPLGIVLACAGFAGTTAAALVPEELPALDALKTMPQIFILISLPPFIAFLGACGFNPVTQAVFWGSLFGSKVILPVEPTLLAMSIATGWALSMTVSPLAPIVMLISRIGGVAPTTLTWRWNFAFSAAALLAVIVMLAIAVSVTGAGF